MGCDGYLAWMDMDGLVKLNDWTCAPLVVMCGLVW